MRLCEGLIGALDTYHGVPEVSPLPSLSPSGGSSLIVTL